MDLGALTHQQRVHFGDLLSQVVCVVRLREKLIPMGIAQLVATGNHFGRREFNPQPQQKNPAPARFSFPASVFCMFFTVSSQQKI